MFLDGLSKFEWGFFERILKVVALVKETIRSDKRFIVTNDSSLANICSKCLQPVITVKHKLIFFLCANFHSILYLRGC